MNSMENTPADQNDPANSPISRRSFIAGVAAGSLVSFLEGCAGVPAAVRLRPPLDLLIRNGTVIDGTGSEGQTLDVGIRDGMIVALGGLQSATALREIDARGLIVAPGFIDIHSHVDTDLFKDPRAQSKVRQGVTTEVTGQDGDSAGPLGGPELEETLKRFQEEFGFECPYRDMDGFFTAIQRQRCAQNLISFIGLGTIRAKVVGLDDRPATHEEIKAMQREVLLGIEQGCFGASTGLEYTPGSFASASELSEVMSVMPARQRLYATHMRNEDNRLLEAIEEAITIARGAGARLEVSHLKAQNRSNWPKQKSALLLLEEAIGTGLNVHADRYPYIAYSTGLTALFPLWSRDGGKDKFLARLRDPIISKKIKTEVTRKVDGLGSWESVMISSVRTDGARKYQGKTLQEIIKEEGVDGYDFTAALLLQEDGEVGMVGFGMDEAGTEMVLAWKDTAICSDASAYSPASNSRPHPRAYGTFPRAIAHYVRDRKITTLPDMVRKMTSLSAEVLGLRDRGTIAKGNWGDIVMFDYQRIEDRATFTDPHQFPLGIPYVIVNGSVVVDNGIQTDALPGKVLRS